MFQINAGVDLLFNPVQSKNSVACRSNECQVGGKLQTFRLLLTTHICITGVSECIRKSLENVPHLTLKKPASFAAT